MLSTLGTKLIFLDIDARQRGTDRDAACDGLDSRIGIGGASPPRIKPTEMIGRQIDLCK